jgi:hypothetical protein
MQVWIMQCGDETGAVLGVYHDKNAALPDFLREARDMHASVGLEFTSDMAADVEDGFDDEAPITVDAEHHQLTLFPWEVQGAPGDTGR